MDFDFLDDTRPRLQLQQSGGHVQDGGGRTGNLSKVSSGICAGLGVILIGLGLSSAAGPVQFLVIWLGLSLVLGPFAPLAVTGGDCRVGVGELILPDRAEENSADKASRKSHSSFPRAKSVFQKSSPTVGDGDSVPDHPISEVHDQIADNRKSGTEAISERDVVRSSWVGREQLWTSEDLELLKKLLGKHPRGTLRRWEVIAEAFAGKYSTESVVKMSKALGQRKVGGSDQGDYSKFLAQRKGSEIAIASELSRREDRDPASDVNENAESGKVTTESTAAPYETWTAGQDRALVSALKAFPKDSPMRWEKVALAVPGKSKTQCLRRFSEIRKSVRSAIGSGVSSSGGEAAID